MQSNLFSGNLVTSQRILYTPSEFAKANLLHLQEIGSLKAVRPHTSNRRDLSSYLFFLVEEGSGTLQYEGREYSLKTGDCILLDCKKAYAHRSSDDLWRLKWAHFYGPNMQAIYQKYRERGGLTVFASGQFDTYRQLLSNLYELADSSVYTRDMKICEKLTSLLTLLMEESWHPGQSSVKQSNKRNLQEIKDYIDHNFTEVLLLDHLAEKFYINKFYLTRLFKEQYGTTINHYQMQLKVTHAKQLLRFSDYSVERIASECGIDDPNYFSRLFKKIEGITPVEYRKKW